jgi:rubrerythrin
MKRLTTEQFIERAKKIHGDKYDYSKTDLGHRDEKHRVCIICPKHGEFWQTPDNHLKGKGCKLCLGRVHDTESFIEKARRIHGNRYDYSMVKYVGDGIDVSIICPIHGEFKMTPSNHLHKVRPQNCPKCSHRSYKYTKEEFIEAARKIHGDKYDYSKVIYQSNKTPVTIICPIHGEFPQTPVDHLKNKSGCPHCNESKLEKYIASVLLDKSIDFQRQKRFKWLGRLSLDFYLPQYGIAIECQGEQHFMEHHFFDAKDSYENRIKRDTIKRKLCKEHNVRLLYYADKQYGDNIITEGNKLLEEITRNGI